ncbi:predicted protein [Nematostella vectensis]|uniref:Dynein heavy chain AAA module D4 domain-containing protein n=1 Tax=Nematostella vectensis TaxID=45351 RepID=A7SPY4_NEMVE|nr:predicted protein [Nematostella vectensis]|eukprot:XP_001626322.1 predicted protein [Nematostella vectensis]
MDIDYNYKEFPINPKAVSLGELYGEFDLNTNEWTDGVLSSVMRQTCSDEKPEEKWILFDAPVDTLWIESMNSVMDDNKVLTLINGERISMPDMESQIKRIFGTMINQKLQDFEEDVKPLGDIMTQATIEIYNTIVAKMLPTPTRIHYLFNLRDISKDLVDFKAIKRYMEDQMEDYNMEPGVIAINLVLFRDAIEHVTRIVRVIGQPRGNMLLVGIGGSGRQSLTRLASYIIEYKVFQIEVTKHYRRQEFRDGNFMKDDTMYEDLVDFKAIKRYMEDQMEDYNMEPGVIAINLVLFRDAIEHVTRIVRVIGQPRGNMLLVGIGGSGRQSLTRLASYIIEYKVFQIEVTKHYRRQEFRDDLKRFLVTSS